MHIYSIYLVIFVVKQRSHSNMMNFDIHRLMNKNNSCR